eukprot:gene5196-6470_t
MTNNNNISSRLLSKEEIPNLWSIERNEIIEYLYKVDPSDGSLVKYKEYYDMKGWPEGEPEHFTPHLIESFERGGWFLGLFENETKLIGAVVLDNVFIGPNRDCLQLKFFHISHSFRNRGFGKMLFQLAKEEAQRNRGAKNLYISAIPSENTVDFYLKLGCTLCKTPDPKLFELEPLDIHLIYNLK